MSIVGLERALYAYVKDASHSAPFDLKTVPLATTPMQDQVVKPGKPGEVSHILIHWPRVYKRSTALSAEVAPVSRRSPKLFGPEKPFVKLRPAYSVKLVFSYVVKGIKIKIKITAKFRGSGLLSFEDTKRVMSSEMRPKSFGTFRETGSRLLFRTIIF